MIPSGDWAELSSSSINPLVSAEDLDNPPERNISDTPRSRSANPEIQPEEELELHHEDESQKRHVAVISCVLSGVTALVQAAVVLGGWTGPNKCTSSIELRTYRLVRTLCSVDPL